MKNVKRKNKTQDYDGPDVNFITASGNTISSVFSEEASRESMDYILPEQSGDVLDLLRAIFSSLWPGTEVMLSVNSVIWPRWEDKNLLGMMLKASELSIQPQDLNLHCLLFSAIEHESAISYAYVFSMFRYDYSLTDQENGIMIDFSPDDYFTVHWNTDRKPDLSFLDGFTSKWEH